MKKTVCLLSLHIHDWVSQVQKEFKAAPNKDFKSRDMWYQICYFFILFFFHFFLVHFSSICVSVFWLFLPHVMR